MLLSARFAQRRPRLGQPAGGPCWGAGLSWSVLSAARESVRYKKQVKLLWLAISGQLG
jgi:hypothetical protein